MPLWNNSTSVTKWPPKNKWNKIPRTKKGRLFCLFSFSKATVNEISSLDETMSYSPLFPEADIGVEYRGDKDPHNPVVAAYHHDVG